jgi:hypothetical protein
MTDLFCLINKSGGRLASLPDDASARKHIFRCSGNSVPRQMKIPGAGATPDHPEDRPSSKGDTSLFV